MELENYRDQAFAVLTKYGISKVVVTFDGSGDSGQIENIEFTSLFEHPDDFYYTTAVDLSWVEHQTTIGEFKDGAYVTRPNPNPPNLREMVETLANKVLDASQYDWYNNDGGYGEVIMLPGEGVLHLDMNLRIMTSEAYPEDYGSRTFDEWENGDVTEEGNDG